MPGASAYRQYIVTGVHIGVIAPGHDMITLDLEYAHYPDRSDLAAIRAYEAIKSLGQHTIPVYGDGRQWN